jgi:hypothetical protein
MTEELFKELTLEQELFENENLALDEEDLTMLSLSLVEMAEDLHCNIGLWHALETYQMELFCTPLPLIWRTGDDPLELFDTLRFQFYLYTIWGILKPDIILLPTNPDLISLAETVSDWTQETFSRFQTKSPISAYLQSIRTTNGLLDK